MNVDKCLSELGSFGRYQIVTIILFAILASWFPCWQVFSFIFILYEPPHHCKVDVPELSLPKTEDEIYEQCDMFTNATGETNEDEISCIDGWVYDVPEGASSLVTELDLVCDKAILSTIAVSVYFCGILVGALFTGQLSDLIGRKKTAWLTIIIGAVLGISLAFTRSYFTFVVVWFTLAMCGMSILTTLFILYAELFPPKERTIAMSINAVAWGVGFCVMTPIAYAFKNWRHFQLAITLPILLFVPFWWFMVESPRWLLSRNRYTEAKQVFEKIARFNNKYDTFVSWNLPDDNTDISSGDENKSLEAEAPTKVYTILDTIRTPQIRKTTIILFYLWWVNSMVYYGLALNSSSIAGNLYVNTFLLGLAEVPSYVLIIFIMPRYGRRKLALLFHVLAAAVLFLIIVIPKETSGGKDLSIVITTLSFLGKFGITTSYSVVWIFSSEVYPTVIRNIGFTACSMAARIGGILAPYVMYTGRYIDWIPLALFAALSFSAGFMALLLPEALNRPLPETIEDGENFKSVIPLTIRKKETKSKKGIGEDSSV